MKPAGESSTTERGAAGRGAVRDGGPGSGRAGRPATGIPDGAPAMTERARRVLKALVDQYIANGQPVGSRTLSLAPGIDIGPASVRSVMGDLEAMGLLRSPHTSAGRVPTSAAFRLFVDTLLEVRAPDSGSIERLRAVLAPSLGDGALARAATDHLSGFTRMAGMVTVPRADDKPLRRVEFLPLSDRRVLAVTIGDGDDVQNRIVHVERDYTKEELSEFAARLNAEFLGRPLHEVRDLLRADLERAREAANRSMQQMIELAGHVFDGVAADDAAAASDVGMHVSGELNLMFHEDLSDVPKLRALFDAFAQKRDICSLLERCLSGTGVQIFIGRESGYAPLGDCSLITAPYEVDGAVVGMLGVVGPKRMAYGDVISAVDITSRLLGAALDRRGRSGSGTTDP